MNDLESHEFIPEHGTLQIVNFNPEFRKKGLVAIDVTVRNYVKSLESQDNGKIDKDSTLNKAIDDFFKHVKHKYLDKPDPNYRIGGYMAIGCTALALDKHLNKYSENFIKQVLQSFYDQDTKVRYYGCEALYNVVKKSKFDSMSCINEIFDGICKLTCDVDVDVKYASQLLNRLLCSILLELDDIPIDLITDMLANRIFAPNPFIKHLIISWIVTLNSVPRIDMIQHLPKLLLGLSGMLTDPNKDLRNSASSCLNEFLTMFKNKYCATNLMDDELFKVILMNCKRTEHAIKLPNIVWMREISAIQPQIVHFKGFFQFLDFIIESLEDTNEEINKIAIEANKTLFHNVNSIKSLSYVDRISSSLTQRLMKTQNEQVILSVLDWLCLILEIRHVLFGSNYFSPAKIEPMCELLSKSVVSCFKQSHSQAVMESTLKTIFLLISMGDKNFEMLSVELLSLFKNEKNLLEDSGRAIVLNLCKKVGFEKFYTIITNSMKLSNDFVFLNDMVRSLNLTLLTSTEAQDFRNQLLTQNKRDLADQLQDIWSFNSSSALSFALWTEKYDLSQEIVNKISTSELNLDFLVSLDQIVQLLDTHIFIRLRLHLLKPDVYPSLLNSLLGISMILPQNETNRNLMRRLKMSQLTLLGKQLKM